MVSEKEKKLDRHLASSIRGVLWVMTMRTENVSTESGFASYSCWLSSDKALPINSKSWTRLNYLLKKLGISYRAYVSWSSVNIINSSSFLNTERHKSDEATSNNWERRKWYKTQFRIIIATIWRSFGPKVRDVTCVSKQRITKIWIVCEGQRTKFKVFRCIFAWEKKMNNAQARRAEKLLLFLLQISFDVLLSVYFGVSWIR